MCETSRMKIERNSLTTVHSLDLGVDFTERKPGEPGEKPSKHGRCQLQNRYMDGRQAQIYINDGTCMLLHQGVETV